MMRRATISAILLAATITATANSEGNKKTKSYKQHNNERRYNV